MISKALSSHRPSALQSKRLDLPARCTSSPRSIRPPPLLRRLPCIYSHQRSELAHVTVFSKPPQLPNPTKCKRSPKYNTEAPCNEPPRCHLPSLPLYRIRNSVSPSPSFTFFASTSRSPCPPVAPPPRRIMLTAPLLHAGADMFAVPLPPRERRVRQAQGKGQEADGCCWMPEVWRYWAVTSRG